jgi:hypothetical protein
VARTLEEAKEKAQEELKVDKSEISFHQDVDVLETWFLSDLLYSEFGRHNIFNNSIRRFNCKPVTTLSFSGWPGWFSSPFN